ncbi:hypothetical protein CHS0354_012514 [Potamilus streckersoni]|uniref:SRCR domain-containing protein n=1 Tax=Potamilus streckersoni TaxID=2493646 RepID=A0AAE0SVM9_9BIVA|nr:hypothetical protein CHS0354_012514 [Potamilus streckersoni]
MLNGEFERSAFSSSSPAIKPSGSFKNGTGPIWLDDVRCNGTEAALDECSHKSWGQTNCVHNEDVAVICRDHGVECYHCNGISDPSKCRDTIVCSSYEACDALKSVPSIIGRKRATGLKTTCCDISLCNNFTIGGHGSHGLGGAPGCNS